MHILAETTDQAYQDRITAIAAELRKLPCFRTGERPYDVSGPPRRTFAEFMASFERKGKGGKR